MSKLQNELQEIISYYVDDVNVTRVCGNKYDFYAELGKDLPHEIKLDYKFPFGLSIDTGKINSVANEDIAEYCSTLLANIKQIERDIMAIRYKE